MMEMERINDNTILIKIENRDLQERGMTVMDLFGNPQQIEAFFQEILEEFEVDDQFIGSEALSFQVMPNSEGIEVYISKNWTDEASNIEENDVMKKILESIHNTVSKENSSTSAKNSKENSSKEKGSSVQHKQEEKPAILNQTIVFESIEDFFELAKHYLYDLDEATLYHYKGRYVLHVFDQLEKEEDPSTDIALLLEYGEPARLSPEFLSEYGTVIMKDNALDIAREYFK